MKSAFLTSLAWITFSEHILIPRLDTGPPKNQSHAIRCVQVYVRGGWGEGEEKVWKASFRCRDDASKKGPSRRRTIAPSHSQTQG